jgi:hypothetical protein
LRDWDFEIEFRFVGSILAMRAIEPPPERMPMRRFAHQGTGRR